MINDKLHYQYLFNRENLMSNLGQNDEDLPQNENIVVPFVNTKIPLA